MKDYSAMTDFEINKEVALLTSGFALSLAVVDEPPSKKQFNPDRFDPCNNPSDAWPIIVENKIDIIQDNGQDCPLASDSILILMRDNSGIFHQDINPLRAAMIVYLMMKDAEQGHG